MGDLDRDCESVMFCRFDVDWDAGKGFLLLLDGSATIPDDVAAGLIALLGPGPSGGPMIVAAASAPLSARFFLPCLFFSFSSSFLLRILSGAVSVILPKKASVTERCGASVAGTGPPGPDGAP